MADEFVSYVVDPEQRFIKALERAKRETQDLRVPLTMISKDWFKTNRTIFQLKSPGKYVDLKDSTKKQKQSKFNFIYPILKATGRLEASITQPTNAEAINEIINKSNIVLGTKVPYAGWLQHGTKTKKKKIKMPARPMVFFGPESKEWGTDKSFKIRPTQWLNILNSYILAKMGGVGEAQGVAPKP